MATGDFDIVVSQVRNPKRGRVVSFDYDGTVVFPILNPETGEYDMDDDGEAVSELNPVAADLMRSHAAKGDKIVIVTCRMPDQINGVWEMIRENGLPVSEVYATGHTSKAPTLRSIGASIHYDDSEFRMQEIVRELGSAVQVFHANHMEDFL